jgi:hypothetical protein
MIKLKERVWGSGRGLLLQYYLSICMDGVRKTAKASAKIAGLLAEV